MTTTLAIARRELGSYFRSPLAYVIIAAFLVIAGYFFSVNAIYGRQANVRPVFQTLHATRLEQRCKTPSGIVVVEPKDGEKGRFARFVDAVRDVLGAEEAPRSVDAVPADAIDCDMVQVEREFRRAIAYDVDYVYKGAKYRSRLPEDPGNHLRVRVSVTPVVGPAQRP